MVLGVWTMVEAFQTGWPDAFLVILFQPGHELRCLLETLMAINVDCLALLGGVAYLNIGSKPRGKARLKRSFQFYF